jgi:hypothetical protein
MAAPPDTSDCAGIVTFGLIWLDYLRRRDKNLTIHRLLLYVPIRREQEVAHRVALLNPAAVVCHLYAFDERDYAGEIDFTDAGNVDSILPPCQRPLSPNTESPAFPNLPETDRVEQSDGAISLRIRGLEFARWTARGLSCGIGNRKRCTMEMAASMAREVARVRVPDPEDRQHPLYLQFPEGWLEAQVRRNPQIVDASLLPAPIYGQVPVFSGSERGVIDLLGIDNTGRLVVIELKATADLHLPFQALDYWLRVKKHLDAGDFETLGYFSDIPIRRDAPRIILAGPALEFHSTTESLLGFISPQIEFTRIGLAAGWRQQLQVMFRLSGAEHP